MKHGSKTRYEAIQAVRAGATLRQAASLTGTSQETVRRWCAAEGIRFVCGCMGGAILPYRKRSGHRPGRLELAHRLSISIGLEAGRSHAEIARGIGFSRTTVSRELSRHREQNGVYDPYAAQMAADRAALRPKARKIDVSPRIRAYVLERLV